jgi:hypothetical protein
VTSLIYSFNFLMFLAFEGSIMANAIHARYDSIPLWLLYLVIGLMFIPLTWYGLTAMNWIMWATIPIFFGFLAWTIVLVANTGEAVNFWSYQPASPVDPAAGPPLLQLGATVLALISDAVWREWRSLDVPPYGAPLSRATDFKEWWNRHRPLIAQTGPLGPVGQNTRKDLGSNPTKPGPDFQGVRWISVSNDAISRISYASLVDLDELIAQGGVLDVDPSEGETTITHVHHMGTFGVVKPKEEDS